jgi:hypothetical protein
LLESNNASENDSVQPKKSEQFTPRNLPFETTSSKSGASFYDKKRDANFALYKRATAIVNNTYLDKKKAAKNAEKEEKIAEEVQ